MNTLLLPFFCPPMFPPGHLFHAKLIQTQTKLASDLKAPTSSSPSMSCQSFLPVSLPGADAEGLASPLWSVDPPEQCEEHQESLSMFCLDDLEPLCKHCAAVSHAGHRVYLLTEAATDCKVGVRYQALQPQNI